MANELKPWKYDIQYGPEGEANYAWVYDDLGDMIATMKTHKAKEIVERMNTRAVAPVEGLETWKFHAPHNGSAKMIQSDNGEWVPRSQAEELLAAKDKIIERHREAQVILSKQLNEVIADNAAKDADFKKLEDAWYEAEGKISDLEADNKRLREVIAAERSRADAGRAEEDGCKRCGGKGEIVVGKGRHGDTIIEDCPSCTHSQSEAVIAVKNATLQDAIECVKVLTEEKNKLEADNKRLREALEIIDDHALRCAKLVKNDPCARAYVKNILDEVCAALGEVKP